MTVEHILLTKGRDVATIEPTVTLAEAARILSERRIGAVVVSDVFRPVVGILSERDIVRAVAARGTSALEEPVSTFMTEKVVTCTGQAAINEIMELMTDGKFRHVPVVEGGRAVGLVSRADFLGPEQTRLEDETRTFETPR